MKRESIFTFSISTGQYSDFVREIVSLSEHQRSSYVCFANVHMTVEAYYNSQFNHIVKSANIVAPDGKPLSVFLRLFKGIKQERICGMDILPDLLREAESRSKSVYFYGNTDKVLLNIKTRLNRDYPNLKIAGMHSPPFRELSLTEQREAIDSINESRADLIFVSLGCPKQEKWMAHHVGKVNGCMLGLGQAFSVFAGVEPRSPKWMQRYALDWLFRLWLNPKRLWKRYIITNSIFLYLSFLFSISPRRHTLKNS